LSTETDNIPNDSGLDFMHIEVELMAYFEWTDELRVGMGEIDEQHKELVGIINQLHDAMLANKGRPLQQEIIYQMVDYAVNHFALEEKLMRSSNFPGYEPHRQEHAQFAAEAAELKGRTDHGDLILSLEILSLLKDWLQNHILHTDMKYIGHFRAHGIV
jgi:hemerythrin